MDPSKRLDEIHRLERLAQTNQRYAEAARSTYVESGGRRGYADGGPYALCAKEQSERAALMRQADMHGHAVR